MKRLNLLIGDQLKQLEEKPEDLEVCSTTWIVRMRHKRQINKVLLEKIQKSVFQALHLRGCKPLDIDEVGPHEFLIVMPDDGKIRVKIGPAADKKSVTVSIEKIA